MLLLLVLLGGGLLLMLWGKKVVLESPGLDFGLGQERGADGVDLALGHCVWRVVVRVVEVVINNLDGLRLLL